ncbi:7TM diverse intracellular signaling domain-containing protein [Magnetococcus sp. PR-3]|uniref:7TM diverse intracellular signaling domain-containing protein n=1 Tax=Magnetococcus sp. PR-3 TaxID=3120355 RepID=UPI002FCDE975
MYRVLLCLICILLPSLAAATPFSLNEQMDGVLPLQATSVYHDVNKALSPQQAYQYLQQKRFQRTVTPGALKVGPSKGALWLHLPVRNPHKRAIQWVIHLLHPLTDRVMLYQFEQGKLVGQHDTGDLIAPYDRPLLSSDLALTLNTQPFQQQDLLIRVSHDKGGILDITTLLWDENHFQIFQNKIWPLLGFMLGGMLIMVFYNLVLYIASREHAYGWYTAYVLAICITFIFHAGLPLLDLRSFAPQLHNDAPLLAGLISLLLASQFSRSFLNTRKVAPWIDRWLLLLIIFDFACFIATLMGYRMIGTRAVLYSSFMSLSYPFIGLWIWKKGYSEARFYILGWFVWSLGVGILIGRFMGWLPTNLITLHMVRFAHLTEMVLLAFALADRISITFKQKKVAYDNYQTLLLNNQIELEEKVSQRTRCLEKQELALTQANQDLRQFAHIISQDLTEPLQRIAQTTKALQHQTSTTFNATERSYLERINSGVNRMTDMVSHVFTLAKLDQQTLKFEKVDMHGVLQQAQANIHGLIELRGATILYGHLPQVKGDEALMVQVLQNLLSNAIKYQRPDITPRVEVQTEQTEAEITITIIDNGLGIAPDQLEHIFGMFQRSKDVDQQEGSGIGLAYCKRIMERHNGSISVKSRLGQGSQFILHFPAPSP